MRFASAILVFLLFASASFRHPFFVSMTEIDWKPSEKKLEIAVRLFTDDLEKAISAGCKCKSDLASSENEAVMNKLLVEYIQKNLRIIKGKQTIPLQFIGREKEEESTWSYFEATGDFSSGLEVENTLLFATQEKQVNLIRFRKPGNDKTLQLRYPESRASF